MSHCGGKSEDAGNGMRKLKQNQTADDIRVKNLLNNMRLQIPLVLLIGKYLTHMPLGLWITNLHEQETNAGSVQANFHAATR